MHPVHPALLSMARTSGGCPPKLGEMASHPGEHGFFLYSLAMVDVHPKLGRQATKVSDFAQPLHHVSGGSVCFYLPASRTRSLACMQKREECTRVSSKACVSPLKERWQVTQGERFRSASAPPHGGCIVSYCPLAGSAWLHYFLLFACCLSILTHLHVEDCMLKRGG